MNIREFDDPYYVESNDYDDTIINDDPFADAFGTPDMYRPDPTRRYSDEELDKMSVRERYDERLKCSKEKNELGQRDIFTFNFKKFGIAASPISLFAISYLYGKNRCTPLSAEGKVLPVPGSVYAPHPSGHHKRSPSAGMQTYRSGSSCCSSSGYSPPGCGYS